MSPEQNIKVFFDAKKHMDELLMVVARYNVDTIDAALSTGDRQVLIKKDFIPVSADAYDQKKAEFQEVIKGHLDETKARIPNETLRKFYDVLLADNTFEDVSEKINQAHSTRDIKLSMLEDVRTGTGPLKPDTIQGLQDLRSLYIEAVKNINTLPIKAFEEPDADVVIAIAITFPIIVMIKRLSEIMAETQGITTMFTQAPTEADLADFVHTLIEFEDVLKEAINLLSARIEDESLGM